MQFYQDARRLSSDVCRKIANFGKKTVGFIGTGNLAEIAYVSVQEWNLQLIGAYSDGKKNSLVCTVHTIDDIPDCKADAILVCIYDWNHEVFRKNILNGIKNVYFVFE